MLVIISIIRISSTMKTIQEDEVNQIVKLFKQKFISPFKIIYMIDQKQADYFKARNKNTGCCAANQITIDFANQSKIERNLSQMISYSAIKNQLDEILSYCEDRYQNIIEKGKKDNLKITNQVQKYLTDNILSQSINHYFYTKLVKKITEQSERISSQIGLWATPATWIAKYPKVPLQLFESIHLQKLFKQGYAIIENKLQSYLEQTVKQILLLQKDGRFQENLLRQDPNDIEKYAKVLRNPMFYARVSDEDSNFRNMGRTCLLVQSIPFQLNMKANCYLTVSDTLQIQYYNQSISHKTRKVQHCKYEVITNLNCKCKVQINGKSQHMLKQGSILIITNGVQFSYSSAETKKDIFILRNIINQARKSP